MFRRRIKPALRPSPHPERCGRSVMNQSVIWIRRATGMSSKLLQSRRKIIHGRAPLARQSGPDAGNVQSVASGSNGRDGGSSYDQSGPRETPRFDHDKGAAGL